MPKRVRFASYKPHYNALRNVDRWRGSVGNRVSQYDDEPWTAVVVVPRVTSPAVEQPVYVPKLEWETGIVSGGRTLQCAAYTMESSIEICKYIARQLKLHGVRLHH